MTDCRQSGKAARGEIVKSEARRQRVPGRLWGGRRQSEIGKHRVVSVDGGGVEEKEMARWRRMQ